VTGDDKTNNISFLPFIGQLGAPTMQTFTDGRRSRLSQDIAIDGQNHIK
jgi:hypothetical protein